MLLQSKQKRARAVSVLRQSQQKRRMALAAPPCIRHQQLRLWMFHHCCCCRGPRHQDQPLMQGLQRTLCRSLWRLPLAPSSSSLWAWNAGEQQHAKRSWGSNQHRVHVHFPTFQNSEMGSSIGNHAHALHWPLSNRKSLRRNRLRSAEHLGEVRLSQPHECSPCCLCAPSPPSPGQARCCRAARLFLRPCAASPAPRSPRSRGLPSAGLAASPLLGLPQGDSDGTSAWVEDQPDKPTLVAREAAHTPWHCAASLQLCSPPLDVLHDHHARGPAAAALEVLSHTQDLSCPPGHMESGHRTPCAGCAVAAHVPPRTVAHLRSLCPSSTHL
mmetsp:Transcript_100233/g.176601  ORF Transcript_100233/g.176601 Transcript_100233/m.176601 type:complete len:328 (-) Transcript_100233:935-1918(-)